MHLNEVTYWPKNKIVYRGGNCGMQLHLNQFFFCYWEISPVLLGYSPFIPHYHYFSIPSLVLDRWIETPPSSSLGRPSKIREEGQYAYRTHEILFFIPNVDNTITYIRNILLYSCYIHVYYVHLFLKHMQLLIRS